MMITLFIAALVLLAALLIRHGMRVNRGLPSRMDKDAAYRAYRALPLGVVGESFHRDNLVQLMGTHNEAGSYATIEAGLVPDLTNPHDPNAVNVVVQDLVVGHLSSPAAKKYRKRYGLETIIVPGAIVGGFKKGRAWADYGVRLDLQLYGGNDNDS